MTMTNAPGPGHNQPPDYAKEVTDRMALDYADLVQGYEEMKASAAELPDKIETDTVLGVIGKAKVDLMGAAKRAEAIRITEKEPYLRRSAAVDNYWNKIKVSLEAAAAVLQKRINEYSLRKEAEERARREREEQKRREAERLAREEQQRKEREAEEARLAAERARKPEMQEAKGQIAEEKTVEADQARVETFLAADKTTEATVAAAQKPAELVRQRHDTGVLTTMREFGYVEILDASKLDMAAIWPHITEEAKLKGLRGWAKSTAYKRPMEGAIVEMRKEAVVR